MVELFMPEFPVLPNLQDSINQAAEQIVQITDQRMIHFDTELVFAIGIIADALCRSGHLQREQLIQQLDEFHQGRNPAWAGGYSPLKSLVLLLAELDKHRDRDSRLGTSWLREVIEGGLSGKPNPESTD